MTRNGREHWAGLVFGNAVYPQIAQIAQIAQMGQGGEVNHKAWMGLAVLAIGAVLVLGRYELHQSSSHPVAWRLDRWTGRVDFVPATSGERVWRRIQEPAF